MRATRERIAPARMQRPGGRICGFEILGRELNRSQFHTEPMQGEAGARELREQLANLSRMLPPADRTEAYETLGREGNAGALVQLNATPVIGRGVSLQNRNPWDLGREFAEFEKRTYRGELMPAHRRTRSREHARLAGPILRSGELEIPDLARVAASCLGIAPARNRPFAKLGEFRERARIEEPLTASAR